MMGDWRIMTLVLTLVISMPFIGLALHRSMDGTKPKIEDTILSLVHITTRNEGTSVIRKYIDRELTKCKEEMCSTVEVSIMSDGPKGYEPGRQRKMVVTQLFVHTGERAIFIISAIECDVVDGKPRPINVLGSDENPISNRWLRINDHGSSMGLLIQALVDRKHEIRLE